MTNVLFNTKTTNMTTLDKMWKKVPKTNEDVDMEDTKEKEAKETVYDNPQKEANENNENYKDDELITSNVRLKLKRIRPRRLSINTRIYNKSVLLYAVSTLFVMS